MASQQSTSPEERTAGTIRPTWRTRLIRSRPAPPRPGARRSTVESGQADPGRRRRLAGRPEPGASPATATSSEAGTPPGDGPPPVSAVSRPPDAGAPRRPGPAWAAALRALIVVGVCVTLAIALNAAVTAVSAAERADGASHPRGDAARTATRGATAPRTVPRGTAPDPGRRPGTGTYPAPAGPPTVAPRPGATRTVPGGTVTVTQPAVTSTVTGLATPPGDPETTIRQDFDGPGLDPQWKPSEQARSNGSSWSPANVRVADGELQIIAEGTDPTGRGNVAGAVGWNGTGAAPVRAFGVWRVRARFDPGAGYGAIIGLYPDREGDNPGFLTLARIDDPGRTTAYAVIGDANGKLRQGATVTGDFTDWHVYEIEWRPDFVRITVDDTVLFDTRTYPKHIAIPNTPMYLYLNVNPGPDGPVPAPDASTPRRTLSHLDMASYHS